MNNTYSTPYLHFLRQKLCHFEKYRAFAAWITIPQKANENTKTLKEENIAHVHWGPALQVETRKLYEYDSQQQEQKLKSENHAHVNNQSKFALDSY